MRRLHVLIDGLPEDAAAWRAERQQRDADQAAAWREEHELAAVHLERTEIWSSVLCQLLGAKPRALPRLLSIQHPGRPVPARPKPTTDPAQIQAFFAAMKG